METAPTTQRTEWKIYKTFKSIVDFEINFSLKKSLREIGIVFDVTDQGLTMLYNTGRIKTFKVNSSINSGSVIWWDMDNNEYEVLPSFTKMYFSKNKKELGWASIEYIDD